MNPIGSLFKLKIPIEELKQELVPNFGEVLNDWIYNLRRSKFSDPNYVFEITYLTEPLKIFIERIMEKLKSPLIVGFPLEKSFGFGKTHTLILLWHIFTSDSFTRKRMELNTDEDIIKSTLVLGVDYAHESKPLTKIVEELKAYTQAKHPIRYVKDPRLISAIEIEIAGINNRELRTWELADLIGKIMNRYRELGGTPRLLLLIDELGWGLANRIREYTDRGLKEGGEEIYAEAYGIINFLKYLYSKLENIAGVVIWVLANQDRKELETLAKRYSDKEDIYNKIRSIIEDLDTLAQRYSRGLGGLSLAEISYDYKHAIEIARHRVLKIVGDLEHFDYRGYKALLDKIINEYELKLRQLANQLNISWIFDRYGEEIRKFYPFSLGLINLLKKVMNDWDVPGTEYIRTVIALAGEATQKALTKDPLGSYVVGLKHLDIANVAQTKLMGVYVEDWINTIRDIEMALSRISESHIYETAEILAKYMLAKGVTANTLSLLLNINGEKDLEKYGTTLDEVQLEIISSYVADKAGSLLNVVNEALEKLRTESGRIDEKDIKGRKYYFPTLTKTLYSHMASYIDQERRIIENPQMVPIYVRKSAERLFNNVKISIAGRRDEVVTCIVDYGSVKDVENLLSNELVRKVQNEGKLAIVIVPPWDIELFNELYLYRKSYDDIVNFIVEKLKDALNNGQIKRPLHVVLLIPDLSYHKVNELLYTIAEYEGIHKFLSDYLGRIDDVINNKIQEYDIIIKRRDINEELKKRHEEMIKKKLEREITEVKDYAQSELAKLSRDIVVKVLQLYKKIVYFSIDKNMFVEKEVMADEIKQIQNDAMMINSFITNIVKGLGYVYDPKEIASIITKYYQECFEKGIMKESEEIESIVENMMLGAYGIKPLSANVAREAIKMLDRQRIELKNGFIEITLDQNQNILKFILKAVEQRAAPLQMQMQIESVEPAVEISRVPDYSFIRKEVEYIFIELPPNFDIEDLRSKLMKLFDVLSHYNAEVSFLRFNTTYESGDFKALSNLELIKPTKETLTLDIVKAHLNLYSRAYERGWSTRIEIRLSKPIDESEIEKILDKYYKKKAKVSGIDRLINIS